MKNNWDLYRELVKTTFKLRYKGSVLGFLWVLMKPFFLFMILFAVFSSMSGAAAGLTSGQYAVYLLIGLVLYTFFNEGTIWGMNAILEKAGIILKINFDKQVAIISSITMALINVFINILIIVSVMLFVGIGFDLVSFGYFLLIVLTMFLAMYGIAFFSSIWMIHLRDLTHIMELLLQLIFYASAVFYPVELIPERFRFIVKYNPIAIAISSARNALVHHEITNLNVVLITLACSIILIVLGRLYFKKKVVKIAEFF